MIIDKDTGIKIYKMDEEARRKSRAYYQTHKEMIKRRKKATMNEIADIMNKTIEEPIPHEKGSYEYKREYRKRYYEANKDKCRQQHKEYYEANKDKINKQQRERYREKKEKYIQEKADQNQYKMVIENISEQPKVEVKEQTVEQKLELEKIDNSNKKLLLKVLRKENLGVDAYILDRDISKNDYYLERTILNKFRENHQNISIYDLQVLARLSHDKKLINDVDSLEDIVEEFIDHYIELIAKFQSHLLYTKQTNNKK